MDFKITEKEKTRSIMYWIPKMHKNSTCARFNTTSKICYTKEFLNLFQMFLRLYTPKLKIFIKMLNFYQIFLGFAKF